MNKDFILNEWVPALRSGKYQQGTGTLFANDCYCCLGVAADLLQTTCNVSWAELPGGTHAIVSNDDPDSQGATGVWVDPIRAFVGIGQVEECNLYSLNDSSRYTFEEIADHLVELVSKHA